MVDCSLFSLMSAGVDKRLSLSLSHYSDIISPLHSTLLCHFAENARQPHFNITICAKLWLPHKIQYTFKQVSVLVERSAQNFMFYYFFLLNDLRQYTTMADEKSLNSSVVGSPTSSTLSFFLIMSPRVSNLISKARRSKNSS